MSVYVDGAANQYGRMKMCHMLADTVQELKDMAAKIGVDLKWIQSSRRGIAHFDICQAMRKKAVAAGAIEIDNRKLVELMRAQEKRP